MSNKQLNAAALIGTQNADIAIGARLPCDRTAIERAVRIACRDSFRRTRLLDRIIPSIHDVLAASGIDVPEDAPEGMEPVLPTEEAA